jgi:hypothetical protein
LGLDVRQELLKFHDKWYSSNMMSLAVVGNQTIDELEKMVVELFSGMQLYTLGLILVWSQSYNFRIFNNAFAVVGYFCNCQKSAQRKHPHFRPIWSPWTAATRDFVTPSERNAPGIGDWVSGRAKCHFEGHHQLASRSEGANTN